MTNFNIHASNIAIIGHGIDLVENRRIADLIEKHGEHFLTRVYTENERAYADASKKRSIEHLAARFAAKEAVLKAIGTGWRSGIAWTDIEITRRPAGRPEVTFTNRAEQIANDLKISNWNISLSHTKTHAIASAIATGSSEQQR